MALALLSYDLGCEAARSRRWGTNPSTPAVAATSPKTLESYVVMARATANRAVVDGRLLPIRAAKLIGVLNDALTKV